MRIRHYLIQTIVSWTLLLAFMMVARPQNLPVVLFIVPFVLLFMALMSGWGLAAELRRRSRNQFNQTPSYRLRITVCTGLVLLLVLQSLGQLSLRDVITILATLTVGYLYSGRSRSETLPKR
ncbi:MAG TPA: hypothetical protein VLF69_00020 [Candidatus Saccharimonadales bacterium]|nr:hypothetical protein [Candidatus Saccharimonadales bacterium]